MHSLTADEIWRASNADDLFEGHPIESLLSLRTLCNNSTTIRIETTIVTFSNTKHIHRHRHTHTHTHERSRNNNNHSTINKKSLLCKMPVVHCRHREGQTRPWRP